MRPVILSLLALALCGCQLVYKLPTRQGNVIEQKQLDKLQVGMSKEQVRFLLGTPVASSALRTDRWDYTGYYKNPRGKVYNRTVSLFFTGETLARMDGIQQAAANGAVLPDLEALEEQEKKDKTEAERAEEKTDSGIIITPPKK